MTKIVYKGDESFGKQLAILREIKKCLDEDNEATVYTNDPELEKKIKNVFPSAKITTISIKDGDK